VVITGGAGTVGYSSSGVLLWTNAYDGTANAIAGDTNGNVFVTGVSRDVDWREGYATVAYSSAGVALWTNRYTPSGLSYAEGAAISVDVSGNVAVSGDSGTIKYTSAGVPLWTNSGVVAHAVTVDKGG